VITGKNSNKMKKALLLAPMGSVHRRFNKANLDALQSLGVHVHLLANFSDGDGPEQQNSAYANECSNNGITIHSLPFYRGSLIKNIEFIKEIKKLLRRYQFDIVHAHTETGGILLRLCFKEKNNSQFFFTPHGMSFYKGSSMISQLIYKPIEHWICDGMDCNLAMNFEELEYLKKWNRSSANYVHGIGLNIKSFSCPEDNARCVIRKEFNIPADSKVLLSIGELNHNKNHEVVIKAISEICPENRPYYIICGVGNLKNHLLDLCKKYGVYEQVIFAGFRSDIAYIISASDIFVFPSFHEGLPVSVLEAMAGGLPTVLSKIRGNVDLVADGENGFLFEPTDYQTLTKRINTLLEDEGLCEQMGHLNIEISNKFSYEVVISELKLFYSKYLL